MRAVTTVPAATEATNVFRDGSAHSSHKRYAASGTSNANASIRDMHAAPHRSPAMNPFRGSNVARADHSAHNPAKTNTSVVISENASRAKWSCTGESASASVAPTAAHGDISRVANAKTNNNASTPKSAFSFIIPCDPATHADAASIVGKR